MAYKVGLQVEEGTARGFTAFVEPSKRNIGIAMARTRGVANKPILVSSLEDDRNRFGGFLSGAYGYAVIKNLFRNTRGYNPTVYGVRIVGEDCVVASGQLSVGAVDIDIKAGYEGEEDTGSWGNDVTVILYPKGTKAAGKWYLEVLYKNKVAETYISLTLADLIAQTVLSKYVIVSTTADISDESAISPAISFGAATMSVGIAGAQPNNSTFAITGTVPGGFTSPVGYVLLDGTGAKIGTVATWNGTSKVGTLEDVALITGTALAGTSFLVDVAYSESLTGGVYNAPVESDFYGRTIDDVALGLSIFKGQDVQIVMNSEFHTLTMAVEGRAFAEDADMLYVFNLPENATATTGLSFANTLQSNTVSNIAGYHGWVKTVVDDVNYGFVPMIGCVVGAGFVRATAIQGDFIHIPPAGVDSAFSDIIEVKNGKLSQQDIDRFVQDYTINVVKFQQGLGSFLISSRTMSTNALYHSIHIRLQTSFYKRVLRENFNWVLQKPNTPELKREITASVFSYFKTEYQNGALETSVPYTTACVIICDLRNNPRSQDRKLLNLDIDWIPTEATEAFRISLNRNDGQLIVSDSTLN